jgi:ankyrin repeat protein
MELAELKTRMDPWFFQAPFVIFPTQYQLEQIFDEAILRGDAQMVEYILEHPKTYRRIKELRDYALELSAKNNHVELVQYLLRSGAGISPIALTNVRNPDMVEYLLPYSYPPTPKEEVILEEIRSNVEKGAPGSEEWAEAMGRYHSMSGRSPFTSSEDCMTKTYLDRNNMKALYTKDQLYHMAKAMGLDVKKSMRKDEICALISRTR